MATYSYIVSDQVSGSTGDEFKILIGGVEETYIVGKSAFSDIVYAETQFVVDKLSDPTLTATIGVAPAASYGSATDPINNFAGVTLTFLGDTATAINATTFTNEAAAFINAGSNISFSVANVENAGTFNLNGSTFKPTATVINSGTFNISGGADVNATFTGTGKINLTGALADGSQILGDEVDPEDAPGVYVGQNDITISAAITLGGATKIVADDLDVNAIVTLDGTASLQADGDVTIAAGKRIDIKGNNQVVFNGDVTGTVTIQGDGTLHDSVIDANVLVGNNAKLLGDNTITSFEFKGTSADPTAAGYRKLTIGNADAAVTELDTEIIQIGKSGNNTSGALDIVNADITITTDDDNGQLNIAKTSTVTINDSDVFADKIFVAATASITLDVDSEIDTTAITGSGTIKVLTADLEAVGADDDYIGYTVIDGAIGENITLLVDGEALVDGAAVSGTDYYVTSLGRQGVYFISLSQETLYVNSAYAEAAVGKFVDDGLVGYNAFGSFVDALTVAQGLTAAAYPDGVTISVTSSTETAQSLLYYNGGTPYVFNTDVTIEAAGESAIVTIPFTEEGIFLTAGDGTTFTVGEGVTIKTTTTGAGTSDGAIYLNFHNLTTGEFVIAGNLDAATEVKIYGDTYISGTVKAGSLLWINAYDNTVTVDGLTGTGTVTAGNIMISTGTLETIGAGITAKGLALEGGKITSVDSIWTLNNIGTVTGDNVAGTYTFLDSEVYVTGDEAQSLNNVGEIKPGEVRLGSGIVLNLFASDLVVEAGDQADSTGAVINAGTINVTASAELPAVAPVAAPGEMSLSAIVEPDESTQNIFGASTIDLDGNLTNSGTINLTGAVDQNNEGYVASLNAASLSNSGVINANEGSVVTLTGENAELFNASYSGSQINVNGASFETAGFVNNRQAAQINIANGASFTASGKDEGGRSIINFRGTITVGSAAVPGVDPVYVQGVDDPEPTLVTPGVPGIPATKGTLTAANAVANNGGTIIAMGGSELQFGTALLQNNNEGTISIIDSFLRAGKVTNNGSTFEVAGESTLKIGTFEGGINLLDGANLKDSTISASGEIGSRIYVLQHVETVNNEEVEVGDKVKFTGTNDIATTDINNAGTITVNGTLTAKSIAGGTIVLDSAFVGESTSKVLFVDANVTGATFKVKVGDTEYTVNDEYDPEVTGFNFVQGTGADASKYYLVKNPGQTTLYVGYEADLTGDDKIIGYNAFTSFKAALEKAVEVGSATVSVVSEDYEDEYAGDFAPNFKSALTIDGKSVSLVNGTAELCLGTKPAGTIVIDNSIATTGSIVVSWQAWVEEGPRPKTNTTINADISAGRMIQFGSDATVASTATLNNAVLPLTAELGTALSGRNVQFSGPYSSDLSYDVSITGTGEYDSTKTYEDAQVLTETMTFVDGNVSVTDSKVYATGRILFTDDGVSRERALTANLVSTNTTWNVNELKVAYYAGSDTAEATREVTLAEGAGVFTFTNSVLNITGALDNVARKRIGGSSISTAAIDGAPALTISAIGGSTIAVGGAFTNAGSLTLGNAFDDNGTADDESDDIAASKGTLTAGTIENSGTINAYAGSLVKATSTAADFVLKNAKGATINAYGSTIQSANGLQNWGTMLVSGAGAALSVGGSLYNGNNSAEQGLNAVLTVEKGASLTGAVFNYRRMTLTDAQVGPATGTGRVFNNNGTLNAVNTDFNVGALNNKNWFNFNQDATATYTEKNTIKATAIDNTVSFKAAYADITAETITNSGELFRVKNSTVTLTGEGEGKQAITNSGTFEAVNATITGATASLTNTGKITLEDSSLTGFASVAAGAGSADNYFNAKGALTLQIGELTGVISVVDDATFTKSAVAGGKFVIADGETATFNAADDVSNAVSAIEGGAIVVNDTAMTAGAITGSAITVNAGAKLTAGAIDTTGEITVAGQLSATSITTTSTTEGAKVTISITAAGAAAATDPIALTVTAEAGISKSEIGITFDTTLTGTSYQYVAGAIGEGVKFTVNGQTVQTNDTIDGTDGKYIFTTKGGIGAWIVQKGDTTILKVKSTYGPADEGFGINKFNSVVAALGSVQTDTTSVVIEDAIAAEAMTATLTTSTFSTDATISGEAINVKGAGKNLILGTAAGKTLTVGSAINATEGASVVFGYGTKGSAIINGAVSGNEIQIDGNAAVNAALTASSLLWLRNGKADATDEIADVIAVDANLSASVVLISSGNVTTTTGKTITANSFVVGKLDDDTNKAVSVISTGSVWTFHSNMLAYGDRADVLTLNGGSITFEGTVANKINFQDVPQDTVQIDNANFTLTLNSAEMDAVKIVNAGKINVSGAIAEKVNLEATSIENSGLIAATTGAKIATTGSITNTGVATATAETQDKGISLNAATLNAAGIDNRGTFDAAAVSTINSTADVANRGSITLNASSITAPWIANKTSGSVEASNGSTISASINNEGAFTLSASTLNAGNVYATNATNASFTVSGASTLSITNKFTGTIELVGAALSGSTVCLNGDGEVVVTGAVGTPATTFTGINTFGNFAVAEDGVLTITATAENCLVVNGDFTNAGAITIDASALAIEVGELKQIISVTGDIENTGSFNAGSYQVIVQNDGAEGTNGVYVYNAGGSFDKSTIVVDGTLGDDIKIGDKVNFGGDEYVFGITAFKSADEIVNLTADTTAIKFKTKTTSYGTLNLARTGVTEETAPISVYVTRTDGTGTGNLAVFDDTFITTDVEFKSQNLEFEDLAISGATVTFAETTVSATADSILITDAFVDFEGATTVTGDVTIIDTDSENPRQKARVNFGEETKTNTTSIGGDLTVTDADVDFDDVTLIGGNVIVNGKSEIEFDRDTTVTGTVTLAAGSVIEADQGYTFTANGGTIDGTLLATNKDDENPEGNTTVSLGAISGTGAIYTDINSDLSFRGTYTGTLYIDVTGLQGDAGKTFATRSGETFTIKVTGENVAADPDGRKLFKKYFTYSKTTGLTQIEGACNVITASGDADILAAVNHSWIGADGATYYADNVIVNGGAENTLYLQGNSPDQYITLKGSYVEGVYGGTYQDETTARGGEDLGGNINITVENATFKKVLVGGDRVNVASGRAEYYREADINLTINGGTFNNYVAAGMIYQGENLSGYAEIDNTNLTITAGTFAANKGVFGGNFATKKTGSVRTTVTGTASVNIVAGKGDIILNSALYVGSYGAGAVGATSLTFTGVQGEEALQFKQIWGGSSSDVIKKGDTELGNGTYEGTVVGKRTLTFTGFTGAIDCNAINGFTDVVVEDSTATLNAKVNMSNVSNWVFDVDSKLVGAFTNDFKGDTFVFGALEDAANLASNFSWNVFENVGDLKGTFGAANSFKSVTLFGETATWNDASAFASTNYTLSLQTIGEGESATTNMVVAKKVLS